MVSPARSNNSSSSSNSVFEMQNHLGGTPPGAPPNTPESNHTPNSTSSTVRQNNFSLSSFNSSQDTTESQMLQRNEQALADILASSSTVTSTSVSSMSEAIYSDSQEEFEEPLLLPIISINTHTDEDGTEIVEGLCPNMRNQNGLTTDDENSGIFYVIKRSKNYK